MDLTLKQSHLSVCSGKETERETAVLNTCIMLFSIIIDQVAGDCAAYSGFFTWVPEVRQRNLGPETISLVDSRMLQACLKDFRR